MKLIWTNRALDEYEAVLEHLLDKWTLKEARKFIVNMDSVLSKIQNNPNMFKASRAHTYLRKAKITKLNSMIYHVDDEEIIVLRIIDNRSEHLH
ncbi:MAG: type II toxin-antitoxin system RelE/ParE family toxin [Crocinitomicaceae bacterium]|nr:type II toxin-antitoxin system RelE/ParE family toxin [Crocinitomicaceae bacterium]